MSRIRGKDTKPETVLRKALWAAGLRYRLYARTPVGRPDLVFPGPRVAVFIDGCFWHGCPDHYVRPRSREEFWSNKLRENTRRDQRQTAELEQLGWRVTRVWEHQVFTELDSVVEAVEALVRGNGGHKPETEWRVVRVLPLDADGSLERRFEESLRTPLKERSVDQVRHTRKWKRPA